MADGLAGRVGRILSGSVHALIETLENETPETVMDRALREVDQAIEEVRAELGKVISAKHLATTRLAEETRAHGDLTETIRLALDQNREDQAKAGVARLLDIEAQIPVLEAAIARHGEQEEELTHYIGALRARRREMEAEMNKVLSGASPGGGIDGGSDAGIDAGIDGGDAQFRAKLAELDDLARENRISERLASFRKPK